MTDHSLADNPVLLDMTEYNAVDTRSYRNLIAGYLGLFALALLGGIVVVTINFEYKVIPIIVWLASLIGYGVWFAMSNMKSDRLYAEGVSAASAAISSLVFKKYGLELVDPIKFDYRRHVVADGSLKNPKVSFQINQAPLRALNVAKGRSVEVFLTLSADRRDVTASIVTPAVVKPAPLRR